MDKKVDKTRYKNLKAREVAKIMVENMKANMEDPEFLLRKERWLQEVTKEVLEKRKDLIKDTKEEKEV